jgi:hypothetical protein
MRAGEAIKILLEKDIKPSDIMTRAAFENAMVMIMALGGSTNAVLHLIGKNEKKIVFYIWRVFVDPSLPLPLTPQFFPAMAKAVGVKLTIDDFQVRVDLYNIDVVFFLIFCSSLFVLVVFSVCKRSHSFHCGPKAEWEVCYGRLA